MAEAELDKLVINIDAIDRSAVSSLDKLGNALKNLKDSLSGVNSSDFSALASGLMTLNIAIEGISNASINKLGKVGEALSGFVDKVKGVDFSSLNGLDLEGATSAFERLAEPISKVAAPLKDMTKLLVGVDDELKKKPKDAAEATVAIQKFKETTRESTGHLSKFGSMLKRMVILRAIRGAINALIQGMKEGLSNAYQFAKLVGYDMAGALDRMASAGLKMKNQLGSAFGEILRAIEPVAVKIFQFITWIADGISRIMAMFNGSDTYLQAQDVETTWEEANKGVKEYKRQLLGLDELNVLNSQKSGSGTPAKDVSKMFKEVAVDSGISKGTFDKLKQAADALKKATEKVGNLLRSEGFQKLLKLIGDILGTAFIAVLESFGDFCEIVEGLLNGDWNTFWNGMDNLGEHLSSAISSIGESIADFFGVNWEEFKNDLGNWVGDLQDGITLFFDSFYEAFRQLGVMLGLIDDYEVGQDNTKTHSDNLTDLQKQWFREHPNEPMPEYIKNDKPPIQQQSPEWYAQQYSGKGGAGTREREILNQWGQKITIDVNHDGIIDYEDAKMTDEYNRIGVKWF